jgi:hypothetical protein
LFIKKRFRFGGKTDLGRPIYAQGKKMLTLKLLVLAHKDVPEADDKTPGECLPLTHGVGGGQQGQGLQQPHLQKTKRNTNRKG